MDKLKLIGAYVGLGVCYFYIAAYTIIIIDQLPLLLR